MPYDWAVHQLRVSLFSKEPVSLSEADWKTVTDQDEAENRTTIPGGKQYSGNFMGGIFAMGFATNRCDIVLTYDDTPPNPTEEFFLPAIGKWTDLREKFRDLVSPFLSESSWPITRIAFGAVLILPAGTREESYAKLDELLKSVKVDPKSRELLYRINWPAESKVAKGLRLNRITGWSSVHFTRAVMQMTGVNLTIATPENGVQFVRLEIDNNTDQAHLEPFPKAERIPIFEELLALAQQNAEVGECQ